MRNLPTVDDNVHAGVNNQQEVGEVGQDVTPIKSDLFNVLSNIYLIFIQYLFILLLESPCSFVGSSVRNKISAASYTHAA